MASACAQAIVTLRFAAQVTHHTKFEFAMAAATTSPLVDVSTLWDASNSDLARQYYRRHLAGDSIPGRNYSKIPEPIQLRLNATGTTFDTLPGLVQRALVWDTGYVENGNFDGSDGKPIPLVRVLTMNGISMAEISVAPTDFKSKCDMRTCKGPDYTWYKAGGCNSTNALSLSRCLVDPFDDPGTTPTAIWSFGAADTLIPAIRLLRHAWATNEVASIHTSEAENEPIFGECASGSSDLKTIGPGSLVIPCELDSTNSNITAVKKNAMKPPKQSEFVTKWLLQYAVAPALAPALAPTEPAKGTSTTTIIVPVLLVALVVPGVLIWWCRRRKQHEAKGEEVQPSQPVGNFQPMHSPAQTDAVSVGPSFAPKGDRFTINSATRSTNSTHSQGDNVLVEYLSIVETLREEPRLIEKLIPYEQLELANQVSNGAYGEVWVGYWNRDIVAIKRLLRTKYQSRRDVETFAQEIQLSARLHHPNIVRFIGVAWDRPEDLCMVLEFLPAGDLSKALRESGEQLTWNQHKLSMARGLASAISYLHSQSPAIIHRDLKSKNVLLTNTLEPKIIDFGVSRRKMDDTMTAGVGTPYWTAPEVLEGLRYTEKSDIYSFGVLLTELDTHQIPYHDVSNDSGGMVHLKILNQVVAGKLRPSVTESCPDGIREVMRAAFVRIRRLALPQRKYCGCWPSNKTKHALMPARSRKSFVCREFTNMVSVVIPHARALLVMYTVSMPYHNHIKKEKHVV